MSKNLLLGATVLLLSTNTFSTPVRTSRGAVTGYFTGWNAATVRITVNNATYNEVPECGTKDG